jgi:hypothetical protein
LKKPELEQEIFKLELTPPTKYNDCVKFLAFIEVGNPFFGFGRDERIQFLKQQEEKWLGREIKHIHRVRKGKVLAVIPLSEAELIDEKLKQEKTGRINSLDFIKLEVEWDDGSIFNIPLPRILKPIGS